MKIEWNIDKKRGNARPLLVFTITLTDFEKELGMPAVRIESSIPKPPDAGWRHCWPGQNERAGWTPGEHYLLMSPSHKKGRVTETLTLPWRESNEYPEVAQSFLLLREAFERELEAAVQSAPLQVQDTLETSPPARKAIAPAVAAERMLRLVKN